ncbi:MAG: hypothetical protein HZC45_05805 [Deltaproteobacteria bacterium]|nr:hypothetical protein [Deltaproteobacteria bacterium]
MFRKKTLICVLLAVVFGSVGLVKAAEDMKARYNPEAFHTNHDENGVDCEKCHLQPYKSNGWVSADKKGVGGTTVGKSAMPQNLSRKVDKTECLECHRWGADNARTFYGGEPAEAGDRYKK